MTLQQLIEKAAQLGGWERRSDGFIRRRNGALDECPITAVANTLLSRDELPYTTDDWRAAAAYIGLPQEVAQFIVYAADGQPAATVATPEETELAADIRNVLLDTFGLR
jgi:hypothetical protein